MNWSIRKKIFMALLFSLGCIVMIGFFQSKKLHSLIVEELGGNFAQSHILWEKERLKGAIEKELSLSLAMARSGAIQRWALNETDVVAKRRGLQEFENFRTLLDSGSWFAVFDETKNYYYNDSSKIYLATRPLKTLKEGLAKDAWYFVTLKGENDFTLNVDYDAAVGKTNLWINVVMKQGDIPIGILGTGLDMTKFVEDFIETEEDKVRSFILNEDGSIFVSKNKKSMNLGILAKKDQERKKIYALVSEQNRKNLQDAINTVFANPDQIITLNTTIEGKSHIVALSYIPSLHWVVMTAIDDSGIYEVKNIFTSILTMVLAAVLVFLFFSLLINKLVIKPVKELTVGADGLRNGDYSTRFKTGRNDEIGVLKLTFNTMAEEIQSHLTLLERRVAERTEELAQNRDKISILLNCSGEGYLKFNSEWVIDDEYSSECVKIFNQEIEGLRVDELLFSERMQLKESFKKIISGINIQAQTFLKEIMLDLLPDELQLGERYYRLRFLLGPKDDFILIITDISEQKNLSKTIEYNERCLSFVVEFVKDERTAKELIDEFERFCGNMTEKTEAEVKHNLHTFKGNFLQKGFIKLPQIIHAEEGSLQQATYDGARHYQADTDALKSALEDDIAILRKHLGKGNLDENRIKVDLEQLAAIARAAEKVDSGLFKSVSALLKMPLNTYLRQFEKTVSRVAAEEGKEVFYQLDCPEDILIVFTDYSNMLAAMYHLITNAVVHGIEVPDIRASKGKDEKGVVTVSAQLKSGEISISVNDDGRGIDLVAIASKTSNGEADFQSIFEDGVTSSQTLKLTSGRGAGMGSVRREVEKLGGIIQVTSAKDIGTTISISIPRKD